MRMTLLFKEEDLVTSMRKDSKVCISDDTINFNNSRATVYADGMEVVFVKKFSTRESNAQRLLCVIANIASLFIVRKMAIFSVTDRTFRRLG